MRGHVGTRTRCAIARSQPTSFFFLAALSEAVWVDPIREEQMK